MNSIQLRTTPDYPYHVMLHKLLPVIQNSVKERQWLLTNYWVNYFPSGIPYEAEYIVISGDKLLKIAEPDVQLIWGVLSGSKENFGENLQLPFSEGNDNLWNPGYTIQNAQSDIEIIAWDSSYTLITSTEKNILDQIYFFFGKDNAKFTDCMISGFS